MTTYNEPRTRKNKASLGKLLICLAAILALACIGYAIVRASTRSRSGVPSYFDGSIDTTVTAPISADYRTTIIKVDPETKNYTIFAAVTRENILEAQSKMDANGAKDAMIYKIMLPDKREFAFGVTKDQVEHTLARMDAYYAEHPELVTTNEADDKTENEANNETDDETTVDDKSIDSEKKVYAPLYLVSASVYEPKDKTAAEYENYVVMSRHDASLMINYCYQNNLTNFSFDMMLDNRLCRFFITNGALKSIQDKFNQYEADGMMGEFPPLLTIPATVKPVAEDLEAANSVANTVFIPNALTVTPADDTSNADSIGENRDSIESSEAEESVDPETVDSTQPSKTPETTASTEGTDDLPVIDVSSSEPVTVAYVFNQFVLKHFTITVIAIVILFFAAAYGTYRFICKVTKSDDDRDEFYDDESDDDYPEGADNKVERCRHTITTPPDGIFQPHVFDADGEEIIEGEFTELPNSASTDDSQPNSDGAAESAKEDESKNDNLPKRDPSAEGDQPNDGEDGEEIEDSDEEFDDDEDYYEDDDGVMYYGESKPY